MVQTKEKLIRTFGCRMNDVDSEFMETLLERENK